MGILHYLDVGIGFALGMAVLALLIGTFTQLTLTFCKTRARHYRAGVMALFSNLGLDAAEAGAAADGVIGDETVKQGTVAKWLEWFRSWGDETIHREELVILLLRRAAAGAAEAIKATGVASPAAAAALLREVEEEILRQEVAAPSAPAQLWRTKALAVKAPSLAAAVFAQFDQVMDRVEDNVGFSGKLVSAAFALVFLTQHPVNSIDMLNRLVNDRALTASLVAAAQGVDLAGPAGIRAELRKGAADDAARAAVDAADLSQAKAAESIQALPVTEAAKKAALALVKSDGEKLEKAEKAVLDSGLYGDAFGPKNDARLAKVDGLLGHLAAVWSAGVLLTWVLVSLGAPFWLGALNKLLGLRSEVANKAVQQRTLREQRQP